MSVLLDLHLYGGQVNNETGHFLTFPTLLMYGQVVSGEPDLHCKFSRPISFLWMGRGASENLRNFEGFIWIWNGMADSDWGENEVFGALWILLEVINTDYLLDYTKSNQIAMALANIEEWELEFLQTPKTFRIKVKGDMAFFSQVSMWQVLDLSSRLRDSSQISLRINQGMTWRSLVGMRSLFRTIEPRTLLHFQLSRNNLDPWHPLGSKWTVQRLRD